MTSPSTALAVCGPPAPGPGHRDLRDRLGLDRDGVERPVDARQRMARVQERRVHADRELAVDALGRADQLEAQAELVRVLHVVGVIGSMPSYVTWSRCTGVSNASRARIAIFAAASLPLTSSVGSASA